MTRAELEKVIEIVNKELRIFNERELSKIMESVVLERAEKDGLIEVDGKKHETRPEDHPDFVGELFGGLQDKDA
ncbi:MAG TPA: hypothetical protein DDX98_08090 [Bacteroidales bacterium]|jgi:hypothetical protein|nr:hypothetical protein [Bacteroidales bacterium]